MLLKAYIVNTVDIVTGCEIILCGDFNARTADRSCVTISSIDENDEGDVFKHERWSQDTKTNKFGDIRC